MSDNPQNLAALYARALMGNAAFEARAEEEAERDVEESLAVEKAIRTMSYYWGNLLPECDENESGGDNGEGT